MTNIYPLAYSIPLAKIRPINYVKKRVVSLMLPGKTDTYIYTTEDEYYKQYEESKYAITYKKGGWDCLRHYEILACNCIPIFLGLDVCPKKTMVNFPKAMLMKINNKNLLTDTEYYKYIKYLHNYTKQNLSCEASAKYVLQTIGVNETMTPKILMINNNLTADPNWVNYSECMLTIGLRNIIGSNFIDYPKNEILYKNYTGDHKGPGKGFSYSKILQDIELDREDISQKIKDKNYDYIIYGCVGRDEAPGVSDIRDNLPFWEEVKSNYSKDKLIFIYGGDASHSNKNRAHLEHLLYHRNFGTCFVRELDI